jgi:hypothetical protein
MPRKKKTLDDQYRPHLAKFFSWKDGIEYPTGTFQPIAAAFNGVTPHILTRYMNFLPMVQQLLVLMTILLYGDPPVLLL